MIDQECIRKVEIYKKRDSKNREKKSNKEDFE